jgi:hypothetical protein
MMPPKDGDYKILKERKLTSARNEPWGANLMATR